MPTLTNKSGIARVFACTPNPANPEALIRSLALPTFALALAISVLTTYAPVLLREMTASGTAIGLAIGAEGAFALLLPIAVGELSDRTPATRLGRRLPYAIAAAPIIALSLVLLPFSGSYGPTLLLIALFFIAYNVYMPPYNALYGDLIPAKYYGRAQGSQALMRGLGLGAALVGGGVLLAVWTPLPFLIGAVAVLAVTAVFVLAVRKPARERVKCMAEPEKLRQLLRDHQPLRSFLLANALWELSFTGLKTFIVLFLVDGLGQSVGMASALMGVVAGAYVVAALVTGRLSDRLGLGRVLRLSAWFYGIGLCIAGALDSLAPLLVGLPVVAFFGAVLLTLPYGLLLRLTPRGSEGAAAGLFGFSRGLGGVLGPILVGLAIDVFGPFFESTNGYGVMWIAIGVPILVSLRFLPRTDETSPVGEAALAAAQSR
jgi:MFS family permease